MNSRMIAAVSLFVMSIMSPLHAPCGYGNVVHVPTVTGMTVVHASDEWTYSFFCSSLSSNNDTSLFDNTRCRDRFTGGVCGFGEFVKQPRIYGDGSAIVYVKGELGIDGDCGHYLSGSRCTTSGAFAKSCVVHECQLSTWSGWRPCVKSCGREDHPRNQTFAFTIVVSSTPSSATIGRPCMAIEEFQSCNHDDCEGPGLSERTKEFLMVIGITFGSLMACTCVAGLYRLSLPKKKVQTRRSAGIDTERAMVVTHDGPRRVVPLSSRQAAYAAGPQHGGTDRAGAGRRSLRQREAERQRRVLGGAVVPGGNSLAALPDNDGEGEDPPEDHGDDGNRQGVVVVAQHTRPLRPRRDSVGSATTASTMVTARGF